MAGKGVAGVTGDALLGAGGSPVQIAEVRKWSFNPKGTNAAYRSNRTGGYTARSPGYKDGSGSCDFAWDPTNPITSQLDVTDSVILQLQTVVGQRVVVPALIDDIKLDVDVEGATIIGGSFTFSANGAWTNATATSSLMGPMRGNSGKVFAPEEQAQTGAAAAPIARPIMAARPAAAKVDPDLVAAVAQAVLQVLREEGYGPANGAVGARRAA
jgi:hypothetical protein